MKLWICGRSRKVCEDGVVIWDFHGVFDTEEQAVGICKTENHFVGPVQLNQELPEEPVTWPGCYYPLVENNPNQ